MRDGRQMWRIVSARFARDVLASGLATALVTVAFTSPRPGEPAIPDVAFGPTGKLVARLGPDGIEPLRRALRVHDTIALFGTPPVARDAPSITEPGPTALTPIATAAAPLAPAAGRHDEKAVRVLASVMVPASILPPARPKTEDLLLPPDRPPTVVAAAERPGPRPVRLLGWAVPGSEYLPDGQDAIGKVAWLGGRIGDFGSAVVDGVRLP